MYRRSCKVGVIRRIARVALSVLVSAGPLSVLAANGAGIAGPASSATGSLSVDSSCPIPGVVQDTASRQQHSAAVADPRRRKRSCFVDPAGLATQLSAQDTVLVDVRHPGEFDRYRMPGSINIPLHLLKTKSFLKPSHVVLVNEGRSSMEMEETCAALKVAGFRRVSILDGGLLSWAEAGHSLDGDSFAVRSLNRMPPGELFVERGYDDWVVIDISRRKDRDLYKALPRNVVKINPGKAPLVTSVGDAIRSWRKSHAHAKVVVMSDDNAAYDALEPALSKAGLSMIYYLAGGSAGYKDHVASQIAMWNEKDKPQRLPSCRG